MKNQPLFLSIIIGIIVVFVIVGASLVAKLSNETKMRKQESLAKIDLEKKNKDLEADISSLNDANSTLKGQKASLEETVTSLNTQVAALQDEVEKLKKLKEMLEDKLKEELTKQEQPQSQSMKPKG